VTYIDWGIVGLYLMSAVAIGAFFTRRASKSTSDFFVAGRSLPWFIAGISIVATTYSSDTPLFVAGASRNEGISWNWFWWAFAIGNLASVFFFSRLWRRTEAVTDVEFVALRYEPGFGTSMLRGFKAIFDGVIKNCVIMASVTLAMANVVVVILDLDGVVRMPLVGDVAQSTLVLAGLAVLAVGYTALSGLYGVVYTDLIQFGLAMVGSISLAVIAYVNASGGNGIIANIEASDAYRDGLMNFFPEFSALSLPMFTFLVLVTIAWWQEAPGQGYQVQRLLATKSERDALLANLTFTVCHYVVRPWPWIIVGLVSMIYFPDLAESEKAYPEMVDMFLPIGLKGIMVASLLAAFMSTLDTHLNWGASYLVNDLYRPFFVKNKKPRHYVLISRIMMVLLAIVAIYVGTQLDSILGAYEYLGVIYIGIAPVMILRWYWWRVDAWTEIVALIASFVIGNLVAYYLADKTAADGTPIDYFGVRLAITFAAVTTVWVIFDFIRPRRVSEQARAFHKKMRIGGIGWRKVEDETGVPAEQGELFQNFVMWASAIALLYGCLLGIGKLLFHQWATGAIWLVVAAIGFVILRNAMQNLKYRTDDEATENV
jgi:SSS family solute:Na+ symporter